MIRAPRMVIFCLAVFWLSLGRGFAQTAGTCVVASASGDVVVFARGAGEFLAVPGLGVGTRATVRTAEGARARLTCAGGLDVVVGPGTEITIDGLLDDGDRTFGLRLLTGIAGFLFEREGDTGVQIRTPSAVAAVRSTEWAMQVTGRDSAVFSRDGSVFVAARTGSVWLQPGEGVDVAAPGDMADVKRWGQARIDRFDALLGSDW